MGRYPEADLSRLTVGSVRDRPTRVRVDEFAGPLDPEAARALLATLPRQLAALALRAVVTAVVAARRAGRPVFAMCGGHVVKVGVTPCLIELMEREAITHLALNGAAALHDVEIARVGRTSEDVEAQLHAGRFGMVDETGDFMSAAHARRRSARRGARRVLGAGAGRGERRRTGSTASLASAYRLGIPATVHVAIGTDTVHHHPALRRRRAG